jgi:hypothetical protein
MEFSKEEYEGMKVNVMALPMKFDFQDIPEFKHFPEYYYETGAVPKHKVLRYIVLCYDRNSPLVQNIPEINKRKVKACEIAGINIKTVKAKGYEEAIDIVSCNNPIVNNMIIRYVRSFYSEAYSQYIVVQDAYYRELHKLQTGEIKSLNLLNDIEDRISSLRDRIFSQDKSVNLSNDFNRYIDEEELKIRPEDIAEMIKNGESPYKAL